MKNLIAALIILILTAGCTFSLQGLNATDGDKTLNVDSVETTE